MHSLLRFKFKTVWEGSMNAESLDKRFATLAMEKGFINLDQFTEAMRIQATEDIAGVKHR